MINTNSFRKVLIHPFKTKNILKHKDAKPLTRTQRTQKGYDKHVFVFFVDLCDLCVSLFSQVIHSIIDDLTRGFHLFNLIN
jgi:hypothetical protein